MKNRERYREIARGRGVKLLKLVILKKACDGFRSRTDNPAYVSNWVFWRTTIKAMYRRYVEKLCLMSNTIKWNESAHTCYSRLGMRI